MPLSVCQWSGRAASQQVKNRRRRPDLAAGPLYGTASPRCARAPPSTDAHAATLLLKSRPPRVRCRRISAGLAAKRHADQAPSQAARLLRASREIKCGVAVPRACHVAGATAGSRTGSDLPACDRRRVKVQQAVTKSAQRNATPSIAVAGASPRLMPRCSCRRHRSAAMPSSTPEFSATAQSLECSYHSPFG